MSPYKNAFVNYLQFKGVKYRDRDENSVSISYNADNSNDITIIVAFNKNGNANCQFICWSIGNFSNMRSEAILLCNEMNEKWRWARFYVDKDGDITAEFDAVFDTNTVGPICHEVVQKLVGVVDEAIPDFMRLRYGSR